VILPGSLSGHWNPMGTVGWDEQSGSYLALVSLCPSVAEYHQPKAGTDLQNTIRALCRRHYWTLYNVPDAS
jgi:hypothetical protein